MNYVRTLYPRTEGVLFKKKKLTEEGGLVARLAVFNLINDLTVTWRKKKVGLSQKFGSFRWIGRTENHDA